jgi:hypothetical protein
LPALWVSAAETAGHRAAGATQVKRWPPIPKVLDGLAGPIRVKIRRVESFKAADGDLCWGLYRIAEREIHLASKIPPALRWHTLCHEWAHAWLMDSGLQNLLPNDQTVEVVCDSLATGMVRSMARVFGLDPYAPK